MMQEFDLETYRVDANAKLLSFFEYLYIKLVYCIIDI